LRQQGYPYDFGVAPPESGISVLISTKRVASRLRGEGGVLQCIIHLVVLVVLFVALRGNRWITLVGCECERARHMHHFGS
jgi:hypothetical protein